MTPKLVIVTEIIAPYRIPVFNALARRQEVDLQVLFLAENDPSLRQWRVYKEEIRFRYQVLPSWRRRIGRYNLLLNRGVISALSKIGPQVLLCGGYNYLASWEAAFWARAHGVPLLLWSESTALDERRHRRPVEFMKARFLSFCRAFVVPGRASLQYLKDLGVQDDRIFTAPNAVDIEFFAKAADHALQNEAQVRARLSLPPRYFLYVGRLVRSKGIFDLLEAYSRLSDELRAEVGLVFVGDGPDRRELMERASRIAPGTVSFHGFVQREGLSEFYALAEALIFPTHSDTWGLVVNEAMACGLPVVLTSVAGCGPDLVCDGWNGCVVQPGDPSQLAAAMARLATHDSRMEMGGRSGQRIKAYSPEGWADGLVKAVESICARPQ